MRKLPRALLLAGVVTAIVPFAASAQTEAPAPAPAPAPPPAAPAAPADAAKPAVPTLTDILGASGIDFTGYLDVAYEYMNSSGTFVSGVPSRVFDYEPNSFNLHQAGFTVDKQPKEGFGGLLNITMGKDANVIHSYDESTSYFDITQAFLQYATGPFTIIGGKFVTLAGAEVINASQNTNYSRSILFGYAIPFTHTGVRGTYAINDQISVILGLNNGWDQLKDENKQKTVEAGVSVTPNKIVSVTAQGYSGTEQVLGPGDTNGGTRNLFDIVATINATDQLTVILNYDYATQDNFTSLTDGSNIKAKWDGIAGYLNYAISDQWAVSLRGEYFDDKDGYRTGVIQKWKEGTVTLRYMPTKAVELRVEARVDGSNKYPFAQSGGDSPRDTQSSLALEGIYKF